MLIVLDARMIDASGIGTYIRNLIKEFLFFKDVDLKCIVNKHQEKKIQELGVKQIIIFKSTFFSPLEQIEYCLKIPSCDFLWTPHFNSPLLRIKKAKYRISTIHDMFPFAFKDNFSKIKFLYINILMRNTSKRSDSILTVSHFSKREILKYLNTDESKVFPIPLGVDPDFSRKEESEPFTEKGKYLLCVGNIKPHKNLKAVIKAFTDISSSIPDYKLIMVGKSEGFYSPEVGVKELLTDNKNIEFTGFVTFEKLKQYYSGASILLFPSLYEGFGLPVLEAMEFNLPIIASNRASIPEVGRDAIIYVNPTNTDEIGQAIIDVLNFKIACSIESYRIILDDHTWKKCATKTLDVIKGNIR